MYTNSIAESFVGFVHGAAKFRGQIVKAVAPNLERKIWPIEGLDQRNLYRRPPDLDPSTNCCSKRLGIVLVCPEILASARLLSLLIKLRDRQFVYTKQALNPVQQSNWISSFQHTS